MLRPPPHRWIESPQVHDDWTVHHPVLFWTALILGVIWFVVKIVIWNWPSKKPDPTETPCQTSNETPPPAQ